MTAWRAASGRLVWRLFLEQGPADQVHQAHRTQHGEVGALGGTQLIEQLVGLVEPCGREHRAGVTVVVRGEPLVQRVQQPLAVHEAPTLYAVAAKIAGTGCNARALRRFPPGQRTTIEYTRRHNICTIRLMTVRVGIRELRDRLSGYLERARAGEQIEITDRGRPIAMLVPLPESRATVAELIAAGKLRPADRTWRPGARRVNAPAGARLPSEHLEEMRSERM